LYFSESLKLASEDCTVKASVLVVDEAIRLETTACALCISLFKISFSNVFEYTQLLCGLAENNATIEEAFFIFREFVDNVKFVRISFFKEFSVFAFLIRIFIDFFKKKV